MQVGEHLGAPKVAHSRLLGLGGGGKVLRYFHVSGGPCGVFSSRHSTTNARFPSATLATARPRRTAGSMGGAPGMPAQLAGCGRDFLSGDVLQLGHVTPVHSLESRRQLDRPGRGSNSHAPIHVRDGQKPTQTAHWNEDRRANRRGMPCAYHNTAHIGAGSLTAKGCLTRISKVYAPIPSTNESVIRLVATSGMQHAKAGWCLLRVINSLHHFALKNRTATSFTVSTGRLLNPI